MATTRKPADTVKTTVYKPSDHLEAARGRVEAFQVEMSDGQKFTFNDPKRLPYRTIARLNDGMSMDDTMITLLGPDQFAELTAHVDVDGYWMEDVFERFQLHYGLARPGGADASSH